MAVISGSIRDRLDDACQECGIAIDDAEEVVPEVAGLTALAGFTGRWTCGVCLGGDPPHV